MRILSRKLTIAMFSVALAGCGGGSGGDPGNGNPPPPAADTVAPILSALSASPGSQDANVSWTTNEPSDSQVEYGTSVAYGSSTTVAAALVTSHTVTLSGLTAATTYHYRVKSRDAAGNLATSADGSFATSAAPPPPPPPGAAITVGQIIVDNPTLETIGVSLPIAAGDTNHNASVAVRYRRSGDPTWKDALPLLRVRPENLSWEDPTPFVVDEQFAGSVFDLTPDTDYEIELRVHDPDGGDATRTATVHTRPAPPAHPATPRAVAVSTIGQLNTALANAVAGDVITLADGVYNGSIAISRSGTEQNPILIRGTSRDGTILNASGATYGVSVTGSYVTIENLTIRSSSWGMRLGGARNLVARQLHLTDVAHGMDGRGGSKLDYYICDNLLEGRAMWPTTDSTVWDFEGIVVVGQGHVVCYNTLSGFGDALSLHHDTAIPNRAMDFYGNEILWTGDNGIELDFTERNVRAFRNRFSNGGNHSMSFQPIWGGPAYAVRNVIYNSRTAPYKFNNQPSGIYLLHNTAVRPGWAWEQLASTATNFIFRNNIFIGTTNGANVTTDISLADIDYDGWLPDGQFRFTDTWTSFADLQARSPYEHNGRLLNGLPFATSLTIPASYTTLIAPLDARLKADTNALDAGTPLPNINDGWLGAAPDLGAIERGSTTPMYGVRP
jgi:hypothetical protein